MLQWTLGAAMCVVTAWSVGAVRRLALRRNLLDMPCARSAHVRPVPRLGGLPLALIVALAMLAGWALGWMPASVPGLVAVSLVVMAVGLVDDLRGLPALPRLGVHCGAAGLSVWIAGPLSILTEGPLAEPLGAIAMPLTALWIAWFINAFNFMDGIDGIAGVQLGVGGVLWVVAGLAGAGPGALWFGLTLAFVAIGFLRHNWWPASIFMGDAGATALGYWLAVAPLIAPDRSQAATGLLVLFPFAFDATATLMERIRTGEVLAAGHQRHLYQRLVRGGWSHQTVALLYGGWAAGCGLAALAWSKGLAPAGLIVLIAGGGAMALIVLVRVTEHRHADQWASLQRPADAPASSWPEVR